MKVVKGIVIALLVYAWIVAAFETMIGTIQPKAGSTLVITTLGEDGSARDRVVARLDSGGQLYVAANHWPRAWYHRLLANPDVRVTLDDGGQDKTGDYRAVAVAAGSPEADQVAKDNPLSPWFRFVTGFPPRYFIRLEPRA